MENNNNKPKNNSNFISFIEIALLFHAIFMFISSFIYYFQPNDSEKWFSRISVSIICFGLYGIMKKIKQ